MLNLDILSLINKRMSKESSKLLVRMDLEMALPLPILQPISETVWKDFLTS